MMGGGGLVIHQRMRVSHVNMLRTDVVMQFLVICDSDCIEEGHN